MVAYAKSFLSKDNTEIYYEISHPVKSHRHTLIFLHGLGGDLTAWYGEKFFFEKEGFQTVVVDLRGHGLSERKKNLNSYKLDCFVNDIISLIEHEKLQKPVIIGHCFGGIIAMILASKFPEIIEALILIDTSYKAPKVSKLITQHEALKNLFLFIMKHASEFHLKGHANNKYFINTTDYDWKRILSDIAHVSLKSYMMISKNLWNLNILDALVKIKNPTLIVEGLDDSVFTPEIAKKIQKRIIKSDLYLMKNANHILVLNKVKDLNSVIYNYLGKLKLARD